MLTSFWCCDVARHGSESVIAWKQGIESMFGYIYVGMFYVCTEGSENRVEA